MSKTDHLSIRTLLFFVCLLTSTTRRAVIGFSVHKTISESRPRIRTTWSSQPSSSGFPRQLSLSVLTETTSTDEATVIDSINGTELPFFSVTTSNTGPDNGAVVTLTFHRVPGQELDHPDTPSPPIVIETGKVGRQASGAVTLSRGESVLYVTAARDKEPRPEVDFVPLQVEHQERFSSAGLTSGAYNKRDGRAAEHEILTCRLIDRPIRPLIAPGWRHETQILSWVLSYDGVRSCDPLAILASSAALTISDIPLTKPVAAVQVGMRQNKSDDAESSDDNLNGEPQFILNPTNKEMDESRLHLTVAGTAHAVLMIEGAADFLPESIFLQAIEFGHKAIQIFCQGLEAFQTVAGVEKLIDTLQTPPVNLQQDVDEVLTNQIDAMFAAGGNKKMQGEAMTAVYDTAWTTLQEKYPDDKKAVNSAIKDLLSRRMFQSTKATGKRGDGRGLEEIRPLSMQTGLLPRVHGSALFTRGETQALATATLGDAGMRQKIDRLDGMEAKRFYLQYTFPPSCVGETGRIGVPGRREVGHGNLAERALARTLPSETEFPYTIRVESLITESHGSSSMASVCGGCLALMDAGVPVKRPVAGIAMGMLLGNKSGVSGDDALILSDITGTEDALGTMDFKVAGDREGVATFQLDIKCEGLTLETMERALEQARKGRLHMLDAMKEVLPEPRPDLPATIPRIASFSIPFESIGKVIGPGGKQIRAIIDDFQLVNMDVEDDGSIQLTSFKTEKLTEAQDFVMTLIGGKNGAPSGPKAERPKYEGPEPVIGENYTGKITGIHPFGVFVEILPGAEDGSYPGLEGLCHVSELGRDRVRNCEGFVKAMNVEELTVKYIGKEKGKLQLSRKAVLEEQFGIRDSKPKREKKEEPSETVVTSMSPDEIDIIAGAIEEVGEYKN